MEHVAATDELITRNDRVRDYDGYRTEHSRTRRFCVFQFQQIRDGKLRKVPGSTGNNADNKQAQPPAQRLPKRYEAIAVSVLRRQQKRLPP